MRTIKYKCEKCEHVEEHKWHELVGVLFGSLLISLGVLFVILLLVVGPFKFFDTFSTTMLTKNAGASTEELRHLALNYTTYDGFDSLLFADDLMKNMPPMRYVLTSKGKTMNGVEETLNYGGDCKHQSIVFAGMMLSVGYEAFVDCSNKHKHCVVKIPYQTFGEKKDWYLMVDPTADVMAIYNNSVNHWEEPLGYSNVIYYAEEETEKQVDDLRLDVD